MIALRTRPANREHPYERAHRAVRVQKLVDEIHVIARRRKLTAAQVVRIADMHELWNKLALLASIRPPSEKTIAEVRKRLPSK